MMGNGDGISSRLLKFKIDQLEISHLELLIEMEKKILQDTRDGKTTEDNSPGMTELVLKALSVYGRFGLTPIELCAKQRIWLRRPGGGLGSHSLKAVSMLMSRLRSRGLAVRRKEGKTYRYFINDNGSRRLEYHQKARAKLHAEKEKRLSQDRKVAFTLALNNWRISEIIDMQQTNELWTTIWTSRAFSDIYSYFMKTIVRLCNEIFLLQFSILLGDNPKLREIAVEQSSNTLENLREQQHLWQNAVIALGVYSYLKGRQEN